MRLATRTALAVGIGARRLATGDSRVASPARLLEGAGVALAIVLTLLLSEALVPVTP